MADALLLNDSPNAIMALLCKMLADFAPNSNNETWSGQIS